VLPPTGPSPVARQVAVVLAPAIELARNRGGSVTPYHASGEQSSQPTTGVEESWFSDL
jgi:hypothetical protein